MNRTITVLKDEAAEEQEAQVEVRMGDETRRFEKFILVGFEEGEHCCVSTVSSVTSHVVAYKLMRDLFKISMERSANMGDKMRALGMLLEDLKEGR